MFSRPSRSLTVSPQKLVALLAANSMIQCFTWGYGAFGA